MATVAETLQALFTQVGDDERNLALLIDAFKNIKEEVLEYQQSGADTNGVYTTTDYFREDGTLYRKHILSGGSSPEYTNLSITFYATDGTTPNFEWRYLLSYDANGNIIAKALDEYIDYTTLILATELTGGTIVEQGGYRIHIFTTSGILNVLHGSQTVDRLMIAGAGGGGIGRNGSEGGGGGAGGMRVETGVLLTAGNYSVIVGAGGAGNTVLGTGGYNGGNTSMTDAIDAVGGGGGGDSVVSAKLSDSARNGKTGGSGGGAGGDTYYTPPPVGGSGIAGQGYAGADAYGPGANPPQGAPGGGAGGPGTQSNNEAGRGPGVANDYTGASVIYCKGGKSGGAPVAGGSNTGTGGDGAITGYNGANGGSGILVIRYPIPV